MYYLYQFVVDNSYIYIGKSSDFKRRKSEHKKGVCCETNNSYNCNV